MHDVAASTLENVPALQEAHDADDAVDHVPALQAVQVAADVEPFTFENVPALQRKQVDAAVTEE